MKKYLFVLSLILCFGNLLCAQGIRFENGNYKEVLTKAKKAGKYVFVDCYTGWCGPCKKMANEVFTDKKVGDYFNSTFVNFKQDMEKGDGPEMMKRYNVSAFPTFLFLDGDGNLVYKALGVKQPDDFIAVAKEVFNDQNVLKQGLVFKQHIHDSAFVANYFRQLTEARMDEELKAAVNEYLEAMSPELYLEPVNWKLIKRYVFDIHSPVIRYIVEHHGEFDHVFGKGEVTDCVAAAYWNTYRTLSSTEKPDLKLLEGFIEEVKGLRMNFVPSLISRLYVLKYNALQDWKGLIKTVNDLFTYRFLNEDLGDSEVAFMVVIEIGVYGRNLTQGGKKEYNPDILRWFKELMAVDQNLEYQIACVSTLYSIIQQSGDQELIAHLLTKKDKLMKEYYRQYPPTRESLEATKSMVDKEQYERMLNEMKRLGVEIE